MTAPVTGQPTSYSSTTKKKRLTHLISGLSSYLQRHDAQRCTTCILSTAVIAFTTSVLSFFVLPLKEVTAILWEVCALEIIVTYQSRFRSLMRVIACFFIDLLICWFLVADVYSLRNFVYDECIIARRLMDSFRKWYFSLAGCIPDVISFAGLFVDVVIFVVGAFWGIYRRKLYHEWNRLPNDKLHIGTYAMCLIMIPVCSALCYFLQLHTYYGLAVAVAILAIIILCGLFVLAQIYEMKPEAVVYRQAYYLFELMGLPYISVNIPKRSGFGHDLFIYQLKKVLCYNRNSTLMRKKQLVQILVSRVARIEEPSVKVTEVKAAILFSIGMCWAYPSNCAYEQSSREQYFRDMKDVWRESRDISDNASDRSLVQYGIACGELLVGQRYGNPAKTAKKIDKCMQEVNVQPVEIPIGNVHGELVCKYWGGKNEEIDFLNWTARNSAVYISEDIKKILNCFEAE